MQKPDPTPTARRRAWANLLLVMPAIAIMAGVSAGAVWLIQQLQSLRCPAGTFLSASGQGATIVQAIPIFLASIGFGFLMVNWLVHLVPPLRNFFDRDARRHGKPRYRRSQRSLAKFSAIALSMMLPISIAASFSQYCLSGREILYQPWPWTGLQHYSWQDVATIETFCTRGSRGGWNGSFFLIMRDGAGFDIMAWPNSAVRAYPEIVRALEGVAFAFSSKGVARNCNVPYVDLLTRRP